MALVEAARFSSPIEADVARLLLEDNAIEAIVFDQGLNYSLGGGFAVRLMVFEEQAEDAVRLLVEDGLI